MPVMIAGTSSEEESPHMETDEATSVCNTEKSILDSVSQSDGFFKSQQIGDKDLTIEEKREIAGDLLSKNVPLFLERYWRYIKLEDMCYFENHDEYEVKFYLAEMRKLQNSRSSRVCVRNRRYEALKKMVNSGSYFSDNEMKKRNPFLYDQLVGKYMTEQEKQELYRADHKDDKFSDFLMGQLEHNVENKLFERQKHENELVIEEDDDDEDPSNSESELEDDELQKPTVTNEERSMLKSEFTNIMYESFLSGKDEFDYSSIDNNVEYDSVHQRELDEEEKYFDEDTSEGT